MYLGTLGLVSAMMMVGVVSGWDLEKEKVRFLDWDKATNNFLFRGNEPKLTNSSGSFFAYSELKEYMAAEAAKHGHPLPAHFFLIDIKLIYFHDPLEEGDIKLEEDFFKANPSLGQAHMKQIFGDFSPPSIYPSAYVETEAKSLPTWQHDNLPQYIPSLNKMVHSKGPTNLPTVIYFHCECGCDRTGEIGGSYAMKYLNMTYAQAYAWDNSIAGRWIIPNHNWAMEWYCEYLRYVEGIKVEPCHI